MRRNPRRKNTVKKDRERERERERKREREREREKGRERERVQEREKEERAVTSQTSLPTDAAVRARIPVSDRMSALL
jgi:hypothetical protein